MGERITGTTTGCLECPHRIYRECGKTGQSIAEWMRKGGPSIPPACPLPKWPSLSGESDSRHEIWRTSELSTLRESVDQQIGLLDERLAFIKRDPAEIDPILEAVKANQSLLHHALYLLSTPKADK